MVTLLLLYAERFVYCRLRLCIMLTICATIGRYKHSMNVLYYVAGLKLKHMCISIQCDQLRTQTE